jgi:hypothetical protein
MSLLAVKVIWKVPTFLWLLKSQRKIKKSMMGLLLLDTAYEIMLERKITLYGCECTILLTFEYISFSDHHVVRCKEEGNKFCCLCC